MHADGALATADADALAAHLTTCASCGVRMRALREEVQAIAAALAHDADPVEIPVYRPPVSRMAYAFVTAGLLSVAGITAAVPALLSDLLPEPVAWLRLIGATSISDVALRAAFFVAEHIGAMMNSMMETAASAVIVALVAWIVVALGKRIRGPMMIAGVLCIGVLQPTPSHALEVRGEEDGNIFVSASETIDDTLIVFGETVEVDGNVTGDLIAVGRRVSIRGHVGGQVITAAQSVTIDGEVDGGVIGFAESLGVSSPRIARNLYGFAATVNVSERSAIGHNAVMFAQRLDVDGSIGRDVLGFAESLEIGSTVGRSVTFFGNRIAVLAPARIAADVGIHVPSEDQITISPNAVIGGEITRDFETIKEDGDDHGIAGTILVQLVRFGAAFVTGLVVLAIVPGLRRVVIDSAGSALTAGGIGLVTLVAAPIIALLTAVTVIGIPLAVVTLMLWMVGIYLAKVVVAHVIGVRLVDAAGTPRHYAVALATGLLAVIAAVNLPFIGGLLDFVLIVCGLGLLVVFLWRAVRIS